MCARRRSIMNSQPSLAVVCPSRRVRPGNTSSFVHAFASSHHWYRLGSCLTRARQGTARELRSVPSCRKRPKQPCRQASGANRDRTGDLLLAKRAGCRATRQGNVNEHGLSGRSRAGGWHSRSEQIRAVPSTYRAPAPNREKPVLGWQRLGHPEGEHDPAAFLQSTGYFVAPRLEGRRQLRPGSDPELWKDPV